MTRKHTLEIRLYGIKCKDFTQSTSPIIINKLTKNRFNIKILCSICNKLKSKFLNKEQITFLPDEVLNSSENSTFNDVIIRDGKAIPLLALVSLVIAGISALTSAAGTAALVVLSNKQADEQQRHNKAVEQIAQGGNIEDDIKNDNDLQINGKGINPLLVSSIIAIIPELIKAVPEAANQIKKLINGEELKIHEPKVLSDDKLIDQSIKFLRGKGYDISM